MIDKSAGLYKRYRGIDFYNGWNGGFYGCLEYKGKKRMVGVPAFIKKFSKSKDENLLDREIKKAIFSIDKEIIDERSTDPNLNS